MSTTVMEDVDIDSVYSVSEDQIQQFRRDGYIKLKDVFNKETLEHYRGEITGKVHEISAKKDVKPLENRDTYGKAFLQVINLWRHSELVKEFIFGKRLARLATELLGTNGVRLYHDQALYKEAGGGYTPWHVDQCYWPLASELTVTAWIPMHAVPMENGPLSFAKGSQKILAGREMLISEESEEFIDKKMKVSDCEVDESAYDLGEVSFHYGFNFHRAGPNKLEYPREVQAIIYMDSEMRLMAPRNDMQQKDWDAWCPGAKVGEIIDTELNPILYERGE